jgi:hypothetical protein
MLFPLYGMGKDLSARNSLQPYTSETSHITWKEKWVNKFGPASIFE